MARRNIFRNVTGKEAPVAERAPAPDYTNRGAGRTLLNSLGELAEKAAKADALLEGEVIVEIDPVLIDDSFVSDRLSDDDSEIDDELVEAIRTQGQKSPVRLRAHPDNPGRYQTVFGHRRIRAARRLSRPVKAVIDTLSNVEHVIAQGQENSARDDLSFIERATFAKQLQDQGFDRQTIQAALATDGPMITRMLSVASRIPTKIVRGIGRAKGIGRDRWQEFAQLIDLPSNRAAIEDIVEAKAFTEMSSDLRFEQALSVMKLAKRPKRGASKKPTATRWQPPDKAITADVVESSRSVELRFKSKDAGAFGRYLATNLDELYAQFLMQRNDLEE